VAIGDVNNDGWPDVLITQYGGIKLFLNNGDGTFTDVTKESGLANPGWGTSAAFLDYDRDGWLDLVVVNYVDLDRSWPCYSPNGGREYCPPKQFNNRVSRLFRNLGPRPGASGKSVHFEDVTLSSGLGDSPGPGLGVLCADFTGDGWQDLFVANDGHANYLWVNQHNGTFKEQAMERGVAFNGLGHPEGNMGIAFGDVSGNGLADLFVTHLTEETNTLWVQGPRGYFQDRTAASGLGKPLWRATGFGTVMGDFDQDGALDIAIANGAVAKRATNANPALGPHYGLYAERNQVFANEGKGHFRDISPNNPALCGTPRVCRGMACGVLNPKRQGALDLVVTEVAGRARIYRNVAPNRGHWLLVRAFDAALQRDAYGAEVTVRAGGRRWLGLINPGSSFLCSNDPRAHFGLGPVNKVDGIDVLWPDGTRESFKGGPVDRLVEVCRGKGKQIK
jgi:hypothetical protein